MDKRTFIQTYIMRRMLSEQLRPGQDGMIISEMRYAAIMYETMRSELDAQSRAAKKRQVLRTLMEQIGERMSTWDFAIRDDLFAQMVEDGLIVAVDKLPRAGDGDWSGQTVWTITVKGRAFAAEGSKGYD